MRDRDEAGWSHAVRRIDLPRRRAGYAIDDWQAGARHLQTDIEQHRKLTKEFFERTFGAL